DGIRDLIVTGVQTCALPIYPPFFDNVHYSELADFFFAWQQIGCQSALVADSPDMLGATTRHPSEVQDADADKFADKLECVFRERSEERRVGKDCRSRSLTDE